MSSTLPQTSAESVLESTTFAQLHQRALEECTAPSVLIDSQYNILHLSTSVTRFLEHQGGDASLNLLANIHHDLRLELRTALFKATQSNTNVDTPPVPMHMHMHGDMIAPVRISIRHYRDSEAPLAVLLVIFEELSAEDVAPNEYPTNPASEVIVNHLESEIKRYKEDLQVTIERSEISTEELKASNEELQIINEELRLAEEKVQLGEERLRLAAETTKDYAIITMDEEGLITTWNAGAERCFGYSEAEVLGQSLDLIFTPEDRARGACQEELQRARKVGRSEDERWHLRKNGSTFYCSGVVNLINSDSLKGFVKIARDLTGSKRMEAEREAQLLREKAAREKMQYASAMKDEFLAVMSHELKHPLNLIHVNAELLAHLPEVRALPMVTRATDVIRRTVLSQAKIIDDLLDLSRARTGKLTLNLRNQPLTDLVRSIVQAARQNAAEKKIDIGFSNDGNPLVAVFDSVRLEQILWNLLSNAIKFTPAGGRVTVSLKRDGGSARLTVADSGEGIAPEYIDSVFDMFNQVNRPRARQDGGMGIGLALVRELVQAHDGQVTAASEGPGRGATFTVWLPLCDAGDTIAAADAVDENYLQDLRILLVDDSQDSLEPMAALLQMLGAQVATAVSGPWALACLDRAAFDLLIFDIGMEGMSGYELVAEVRRRADSKDLPAIALTGYGRPQDEAKALQHGFNAHLSKPTSLDDLKRVIAHLVRQSRDAD